MNLDLTNLTRLHADATGAHRRVDAALTSDADLTDEDIRILGEWSQASFEAWPDVVSEIAVLRRLVGVWEEGKSLE